MQNTPVYPVFAFLFKHLINLIAVEGYWGELFPKESMETGKQYRYLRIKGTGALIYYQLHANTNKIKKKHFRQFFISITTKPNKKLEIK
jgi:hypothetical protein